MGVDIQLSGAPEFDQLELLKTGLVTLPAITAPPQETTVVLTHNLGYRPIVIASVLNTSGNEAPLPFLVAAVGGGSDGSVVSNIYVYPVTETDVTFVRDVPGIGSAAPALQVRYYLLRQRGTTG